MGSFTPQPFCTFELALGKEGFQMGSFLSLNLPDNILNLYLAVLNPHTQTHSCTPYNGRPHFFFLQLSHSPQNENQCSVGDRLRKLTQEKQ